MNTDSLLFKRLRYGTEPVAEAQIRLWVSKSDWTAAVQFNGDTDFGTIDWDLRLRRENYDDESRQLRYRVLWEIAFRASAYDDMRKFVLEGEKAVLALLRDGYKLDDNGEWRKA